MRSLSLAAYSATTNQLFLVDEVTVALDVISIELQALRRVGNPEFALLFDSCRAREIALALAAQQNFAGAGYRDFVANLDDSMCARCINDAGWGSGGAGLVCCADAGNRGWPT